MGCFVFRCLQTFSQHPWTPLDSGCCSGSTAVREPAGDPFVPENLLYFILDHLIGDLGATWFLLMVGMSQVLFASLYYYYDAREIASSRTGLFVAWYKQLSRYSLTVYFLHWLLVCWPLWIIYFLTGKVSGAGCNGRPSCVSPGSGRCCLISYGAEGMGTSRRQLHSGMGTQKDNRGYWKIRKDILTIKQTTGPFRYAGS